LPCLLATTPVHLRALCGTAAEWPNLQAILCSTASLSQSLALKVEQTTGAALWEIYGSTETLSFALRATARETVWRPYADVSVFHEAEEGAATLSSPHLAGPTRLQDLLRIEADGGFTLLGRCADMVKIGGKRVSLAELNRRLTDIDGVEDGVCLAMPDAQREFRVMAVVVSDLSKQDIAEALRPYLDEVFLPKRIDFVEKIPRNGVGKVARAELEKLVAAADMPETAKHAGVIS
jgi:acyl-coenzyme A synthetase/AMP-(fatty) acid ligase